MKTSIYRLLTLIVSVVMFLACGDADMNNPIGTNGAIPEKVTVTNITNINGGAIIDYQVPNDNNVCYIEAVYDIKGKTTKTISSFYSQSLTLEGFPEAKEYSVLLYTVSNSDVRSEAVNVKVSPTTPPFAAVAESLHIKSIFGGVKAMFENPTAAYLQIAFFEKNELNKWEELQTVYTSMKSGTFYVRGLAAVEKTFAVVCRDHWQNVSDTVLIKATPLYEELADWKKFKSYPLPTDITYELPLLGQKVYHTGAPDATDVEIMWNGEAKVPFKAAKNVFFQNVVTGLPCSGLPSSITIDLGRPYTISRFVWWPRQSTSLTNVVYTHLYSNTHPKTFQLWGSNNPSPDGSYDTWKLIGNFESFRPSGNTTPGDANSTEEDRKTAITGESFDMPEEIVAYRYIRYKVFSTWGSQAYWAATELQFYGSPN